MFGCINIPPHTLPVKLTARNEVAVDARATK